MSIKLTKQRKVIKVSQEEYELLIYKRQNKIPLNIKGGSITFHYNQNGKLSAYETHIRSVIRTFLLRHIDNKKTAGPSDLANTMGG